MNSTKPKIKYLTQTEAINLFNSIEHSNSCHALRDLAIFKLAYRCGLKASEISLLKLENYNISKGELYCNRLKGSVFGNIEIKHRGS